MDPRWSNLASLGTCLVLGLLALGPVPEIPGLAVVDLGFASLGHLAGGVVGAVVAGDAPVAVGGLVVPVAVPLALAARFLPGRGPRAAGALCLAWAATVLTALAAGLLQAAQPGPAGPGAPHDWTVVLGPRGLHALDRAADVAGGLRTGALALILVAVAVSAVPLVAEAARATSVPAARTPTLAPPTRRRI